MQLKKLKLQTIMNQWQGQQLILKVQNQRLILTQRQKYNQKIKKNSSVGLFSQISYNCLGNNNGNVGNRNNINYNTNSNSNSNINMNRNNQYRNKSNTNINTNIQVDEQKFIIKARSRSKTQRVSLADLGQIYNQSRYIQNKNDHNRRKSSQLHVYGVNQNKKYTTNTNTNHMNNMNMNMNKTYKKEYNTNSSNTNSKININSNSNSNSNIKLTNNKYQTNSRYTNTNKRALQQIGNQYDNHNNIQDNYNYQTSPNYNYNHNHNQQQYNKQNYNTINYNHINNTHNNTHHNTHNSKYNKNTAYLQQPNNKHQPTSNIPQYTQYPQYKQTQQQSNPLDQQQLIKIKQSINQIKLPDNTKQCPQYASANDKFQRMKRQILQKIIQSGQIDEISDILKQIRQAADQIIARHNPYQYKQLPIMKKNVFSFKDITCNNQQLHKQIQLNPIAQEHEQRSQQQQNNNNNINNNNNNNIININIDNNLPQFKDDAGSISSILSLNGKKDQSKDYININIDNINQNDNDNYNEDICRINNVFICQSQKYIPNKNNIDGNNSNSSIKPIVLEQIKSQTSKDIIQPIKFNQIISNRDNKDVKQSKNNNGFNGQSEYSMRVKDTIMQSYSNNINNVYGQQKIEQKQQPIVKQSLIKQSIKQQPIQNITSINKNQQNTYTYTTNYNNNKTQPIIPLINITNNQPSTSTFDNKNIFIKKQKAETYQQTNKPIKTSIPITPNYIPNAPSNPNPSSITVTNTTSNTNQNYYLQKITAQPVKIIKNLQEAQKFDPQVTKYTELKVKYLQTRIISPQIIKIPSPLRFRRKQEVVKCLVANQIVQRQSNSIQF